MIEQLPTPSTIPTATIPSATIPTGTEPETVMDDFVFGGIEVDDGHLLADMRRRGLGLRHRFSLHPRDPQPGESVQITVYVGPEIVVDRVTAYVTTDGSTPKGIHGVAEHGFAVQLAQVDTKWDTVLWDYVALWQGTIPAQPAETFVQYMIEGWRGYDATVSQWSSEPNLDKTIERPTRYGYTVDTYRPPTWAYEAVVYQIFVDRFTGNQARWLSPHELNEFTGGTIQGVRDKLDYLADLGISAIWLSPIFAAVSYHAYDTVDYYEIDPRFGTKADLRALVVAAHARGIRIILDFVANHTGETFAPFVEAKQGNPTYREWFSFDTAYTHGYRTFFDVASMPQLNTDAPAVSRYLCAAAVYWLTEFDVDGFRLDYAAGPSHAFWSEFQAACKTAKPDCWLFGEATLAGEDLRSYQGRLDGCLDFSFCRLIRQLCIRPEPQITLGTFFNHLLRGRHFFGDTFLPPAFIDNHDMNRFLWLAKNDTSQLRLALGLLFALGQSPILYYGTEVGLSQPRAKGPWREEARHPMIWDVAQQDQALLAFCREWITQRRLHPALTTGDLTILQLDEARNVGLLVRRSGEDQVLIAVNVSAELQSVALPAGQYHYSGPPSEEHQLSDRRNDHQRTHTARDTVDVAPHSVLLLTLPTHHQ